MHVAGLIGAIWGMAGSNANRIYIPPPPPNPHPTHTRTRLVSLIGISAEQNVLDSQAKGNYRGSR